MPIRPENVARYPKNLILTNTGIGALCESMHRPVASLAALLLLILLAPLAQADTGLLRICRAPGIVGLLDGKSVPIPAGSGFVNWSEQDDKIRVEVKTTRDVTIGPQKKACVTVDAELVSNRTGKQVEPDHIPLRAQFSIAGLELIAYIASAFH